MKVNDLLNEIGDVLQEDFTNAVLWPKIELLGYLKQVVSEFFSRTSIAHKSFMEVVDGTSGEASVPDDFNGAFYILFDQKYKDLVKLEELDFIESDWSSGGTPGTPRAATVFGSGSNAKIRFTPVPSTVMGAFGSSVLTDIVVSGIGTETWDVTTTLGALITTTSSNTGTSITIAGPSTFWDLTANDDGVLITTASALTVGDVVYLVDTSTSAIWTISTDDLGVLETISVSYGLTTQVRLDGVDQTITQIDVTQNDNYGIIVDAYATGVSTTPDSVIRINEPVGMVLYDRTSDDSMDLWYIGHGGNITTIEDELFISGAFIPIIKHGILALAYGHESDGQDLKKYKLLTGIFTAECDAVKRIFGVK